MQSAPEVERTFYTLARDLETARELYAQLNSKRVDADAVAAAAASSRLSGVSS